MDTPTLTLVERLILANQFKIMAALEIDGDSEAHARHATILEEGYAIQYGAPFERFMEPVAEDDCRYVMDVLDMYTQLQWGLAASDEKEGLKDQDVDFPGFDGNRASGQMSYADFLVANRRWTNVRLTKGSMNSHGMGDTAYPAMLDRWRATADNDKLTIDDVKVILGK